MVTPQGIGSERCHLLKDFLIASKLSARVNQINDDMINSQGILSVLKLDPEQLVPSIKPPSSMQKGEIWQRVPLIQPDLSKGSQTAVNPNNEQVIRAS